MVADISRAGLARGRGFGRGGGTDSLAARREAAQRRLSSSVRQAELVECALRGLDEQLADYAVADPDGTLRTTARALLGIAYTAAGYDVTIVPAAGDIGVRVQYTPFGPEAELIDLALLDAAAATDAPLQPTVAYTTAGPPGAARPAPEAGPAAAGWADGAPTS